MKAIILILAAALVAATVIFLAVLYVKNKQVRGLSSALIAQQKATRKAEAELKKVSAECNRVAVDHGNLLHRVTRLCSTTPQKVTAQYLSMKMSNLLQDFFIVDGKNFYLDVVTPEKPAGGAEE